MSSNLKTLSRASVPAPLILGERHRWLEYLSRAWRALRKRTRRNPALSRWSDWTFPGL